MQKRDSCTYLFKHQVNSYAFAILLEVKPVLQLSNQGDLPNVEHDSEFDIKQNQMSWPITNRYITN